MTERTSIPYASPAGGSASMRTRRRVATTACPVQRVVPPPSRTAPSRDLSRDAATEDRRRQRWLSPVAA